MENPKIPGIQPKYVRFHKGSKTSLKFQYFIERYLGSRTRLRPENSSVGVIFCRRLYAHKIFFMFEIFQ